MNDISLLLQVQARVATFLAELPGDQILDLAEGRSALALVTTTTVSDPAPAPAAAPSSPPAPASPPETLPVATSPAGTRAPKGNGFDPHAVAAQLRSSATLDEATERLASLNLKAVELREVAKALNVPASGRKDEVAKRVLTLTVGARSKHTGLRRG